MMFGKENNILTIILNVRETDNFTYKRTFFTQETLLSEWNYMSPAQSTLTTYENVDGMWNASVDIEWIMFHARSGSQWAPGLRTSIQRTTSVKTATISSRGLRPIRNYQYLKRFYLNVAYSLSYYKRFGGNSYDLNNQILNVATRCKILKRRGDISFTAYDTLNPDTR